MTEQSRGMEMTNEEIADRIIEKFFDVYIEKRSYQHAEDFRMESKALLKEALDQKDSQIQALKEEVGRFISVEKGLTERVIELQEENKSLRSENEKWQKMCEKFVGVSMLADEFANEPHEPESFGDYVQNLISQIEDVNSLKSTIKQLVEALREIGEMFEGEADINNAGGPNRAMRIEAIIFKVDALPLVRDLMEDK